VDHKIKRNRIVVSMSSYIKQHFSPQTENAHQHMQGYMILLRYIHARLFCDVKCVFLPHGAPIIYRSCTAWTKYQWSLLRSRHFT